jgi:cytosine/uracil/thiamine/allantoin permease
MRRWQMMPIIRWVDGARSELSLNFPDFNRTATQVLTAKR